MGEPGWIGGIRADTLKLSDQQSGRGRSKREPVGLSTLDIPGEAKPTLLKLEAWFEDEGDERRGRAAETLLSHHRNIPLRRHNGDTWAQKSGLLVNARGRVNVTVDPGLTRLEARVVELSGTEDGLYRAIVKTVIQDNAFSNVGVARVTHPGQGSKTTGGGSTSSDGRWTTDPDGVSGLSYSAGKVARNAKNPLRITGEAKDWARLSPFVVPNGHLDNIPSEGTTDPTSMPTSPTPMFGVLRVSYDWDGNSYDLGNYRAQAAYSPSGANETLETGLVPTLESSGADTFLMPVWLRADGHTNVDLGTVNTDANVSNASVEAWNLSKAWSLDDGDLLSTFVAGHGPAIVYVNGTVIVPLNPHLITSQLDAVSIVASNGNWKITDTNPHRTVLESRGEDVLRLWRNGLIEYEPPGTSFEVRPADTSKGTGSAYWQPHSSRDLRVASLKDYTASISTETATVSATESGQRFGLTLGGQSDSDMVFQRARTTWRPGL